MSGTKRKQIEIDEETIEELLDLRFALGLMIEGPAATNDDVFNDDSPLDVDTATLEQAISLIDRIADAYEEA